jgi:hypothetical protein
VLGREVVTLVDGEQKAGYVQQVTYHASKLASGTYFSRLEFNGKQLIRKMTLLK